MDRNIFYYLLTALDKAKENNECADYDIDLDKMIVYADFYKDVLEVNSLSSANEGNDRYRYAVSDILSDYGYHVAPKNVIVYLIEDGFIFVKFDLYKV